MIVIRTNGSSHEIILIISRIISFIIVPIIEHQYNIFYSLQTCSLFTHICVMSSYQVKEYRYYA